MIVSYKHKFIFFALPKTASQSIRVALRPHMHSHDWEQCTLYEKKFFPVKEFRKINHGHISYDQLSKYLIPNILSDLFKFTFVRNPYDRFVSICCFRNWNNDSMISHPLDTMKRIIQSKEVESTLIYDPQYKFVK